VNRAIGFLSFNGLSHACFDSCPRFVNHRYARTTTSSKL
jgi:hypothetical protein